MDVDLYAVHIALSHSSMSEQSRELHLRWLAANQGMGFGIACDICHQ